MNYTDEQLQAAIDAAFPVSYYSSLMARNDSPIWPGETSCRLAIARAFLAELGKIKSAHPDAQENWNQYASKPAWALPPPPAGHKWHRDDWTEEMLPEGYRPLLGGELIEKSDEVWQYAEGPWKNETIAVGLTVSSSNHHFRTRRPLPSWSQANAEPKKAEAAGVDLDAQPSDEGLPRAYQYADYILNHFSKNSHADKLLLAKDLEIHGWTSKANQPVTFETHGWRYADEQPEQTSCACGESDTPGIVHCKDAPCYHEEPAQPWQPAHGDVVRLKSGGPEMTVNTIVETENGETLYGFVWIAESGQPFGCKLPAIMVEPVNKKHD